MKVKKFSTSSISQSLKFRVKVRFQTRPPPSTDRHKRDSIKAVLFEEQENNTGNRDFKGVPPHQMSCQKRIPIPFASNQLNVGTELIPTQHYTFPKATPMSPLWLFRKPTSPFQPIFSSNNPSPKVIFLSTKPVQPFPQKGFINNIHPSNSQPSIS
jgi:hypothetical protein